jgi:hypothetical protein
VNDRFGHAAECRERLLTGVELDIPKEYLSDLVYGKTVTIPDIKIDRYSRTVSRAMLGNMDAGLEQINAGMAWHFKKYQ